jgi:hypothetical protein
MRAPTRNQEGQGGRRRVLESYRAEREFRDQLGLIRDFFAKGPNYDRRLLMALNASVQRLVDEVAETKDFKESFLKSQDIITKQIADLKDEISRLQAGQTIDEENLAALNKAADDLDETNKALADAVPAEPKPNPAVEGMPLTHGTQPVTHDQAGNPIAPDAEGQPKPPEG